MSEFVEKTVLIHCEATKISGAEDLQTLWNGYGKIARFHTDSAKYPTAIVKHIQLKKGTGHPRGWSGERSHQRKFRSYEVEQSWYKNYSAECDELCRVPHCLGMAKEGENIVMVLEDLDGCGFHLRKTSLNISEIHGPIRWLAHFHAYFLGRKTKGLWKQGTYWHLKTRPDELAALTDQELKEAAKKIDRKMQETDFLTLVHGDAKCANFCFSSDSKVVAAVDFQYVGGGCGMKDLAYFVGSCMAERECAKYEQFASSVSRGLMVANAATLPRSATANCFLTARAIPRTPLRLTHSGRACLC